MSDDIPRCICGHVESFHERDLGDEWEWDLIGNPFGGCVIRNCPCQEFEDEMEEDTNGTF